MLDYWRQAFRLVENGFNEGGPERILVEAANHFPHNEVFGRWRHCRAAQEHPARGGSPALFADETDALALLEALRETAQALRAVAEVVLARVSGPGRRANRRRGSPPRLSLSPAEPQETRRCQRGERGGRFTNYKSTAAGCG
jgi:hypothetical protein